MKDGQDPPTPRFIRSHGMRFPNDPAVLTQKMRRALRAGTYEAREYKALLAMVRPRDTVLELGAGIGFMSTAAAVKCRAREVHAFEANPALIPYIATVHAANAVTAVTVHNALLGPNVAEPADFYVRDDPLGSSMTPMEGDEIGQNVSVARIEVRDIQATVDDIRPTALVCDIEGAEAELFNGVSFDALRCAIIELHPQWIGQQGVQNVFDAMHRAGLSYFPWPSNKKVVAFRKGW